MKKKTITAERATQTITLRASKPAPIPISRQCKPVKVATLGSIAKKYPFHIARKFEAILLSLSYLRQTAVILDSTVKTSRRIATKSYPERLKRRIELNPY